MSEFAIACGVQRPIRLKVDDGRGASHLVHLDRPFAVLGRNPAADLQLDHEQVCLRHAYLQVVGGRLWAIDLSIRGGLQWPHGRPIRCGPLVPDAPVQIGPFTIQALDEPGEAEPGLELKDPIRARPPEPAPFLRNSDDEGPGPWRLSRMIQFLGRSSLCRVRLQSRDVSQTHAALIRAGGRLWIVDLLGRGGLLVNGVATRFGLLEPGGVLDVGSHRLHVEPGGQSTALRVADRSARREVAELEPIRPTWIADPAGVRAAEGGAALLMLLEQMGRMQQQMLDQFQQAMQMLFTLSGDREREDRDRVREELDRLHQIASELTSLQTRVEEAPTASERPGPALGSSPRSEESRPADPEARTSRRGRPGPEPTSDSLAWVCRRLHEMQNEQKDRWDRVNRLLRRPSG